MSRDKQLMTRNQLIHALRARIEDAEDVGGRDFVLEASIHYITTETTCGTCRCYTPEWGCGEGVSVSFGMDVPKHFSCNQYRPKDNADE